LNVFKEFLPTLLDRGVLTTSTKIIIPNKIGWDQLPAMLESSYETGSFFSPVAVHPIYCS
jgi:hypothetical protein